MNVQWALHALSRHGLAGIFLVIALEYACLPMPSEVLLPFAGMAAAAADIPLPLVVAVSVLAGLMGSTVCYLLGAWGGRPLLARLLRRFPRALKALDSTSAWQAEAGGLSVLVARVIPLFRTWVSFASGLARQPFGAFALYSSMGILVWNTVLLLSGHYLFAIGMTAWAGGLLWLMPAAGLGLSIIAFMLRRHIKKRR